MWEPKAEIRELNGNQITIFSNVYKALCGIMYILWLNSIREQNNEAYRVWSEMLSFLFSYLRNLKLHKICLTQHIMWFQIWNMFLLFTFFFSVRFILVVKKRAFQLCSSAWSEQLAFFMCGPSNELFRYLFVIWCSFSPLGSLQCKPSWWLASN